MKWRSLIPTEKALSTERFSRGRLELLERSSSSLVLREGNVNSVEQLAVALNFLDDGVGLRGGSQFVDLRDLAQLQI